MLKLAREAGGGRKLPVLPMWMAEAAVPLLGLVAKLRRQRPLYTRLLPLRPQEQRPL